MMMPNPDFSKLRWRCRRGLLELDVLLERFLHQQYPHLSLQEKQIFYELLDQTDQQLWQWLSTETQPSRLEWQTLITQIKQCR